MAQDEVDDLRQRLSKTQNDLNLSMGENDRLSEELTRQQALYTELKKMRGRGEEMDMLQELEQVNYTQWARNFLKSPGQKKLVKSNKSISRIFF